MRYAARQSAVHARRNSDARLSRQSQQALAHGHVAARPDILNHNIETVPRLYRIAKVRRTLSAQPALSWKQAKAGICRGCEPASTQVTKTGIIVGLGEEMHELLSCLPPTSPTRKVDILTIGQYLRPSRDHLPMSRFYTPDEFAFLKHEALGMGFRHVESGPLVRSSYHAHEQAQSTGLA